MELSVIIPVHNAEKTIEKCVRSIADSDFDRDFEIIAVDDGSTDKSVEKIEGLGIRIVRQDNKGAAAARNAGARNAVSDLLVFVDSDVVFFKDTLRRIYEHLQKNDVDYVSIRYSKTPANNGWIHKYKALADFSYYYDFVFSDKEKSAPIRQVVISGGVESYKKRVFDKLGGFDERIKGADVEMEKMVMNVCRNYDMLADGKIRTMHYFPGFWKLLKIYFGRTYNFMDITSNHEYNQPYFKKNRIRIALGALTAFSLISSIFVCIFFGHTALLILPIVFFPVYFLMHIKMFVAAFKKYGLLFTVYALMMNLFFCSVIGLAAALGIIKNMVRR